MVTKPERVGLVERHPDPFPVRATAAGAAIVDGRRAERMARKRRPAKGPRGPWFSGPGSSGHGSSSRVRDVLPGPGQDAPAVAWENAR